MDRTCFQGSKILNVFPNLYLVLKMRFQTKIIVSLKQTVWQRCLHLLFYLSMFESFEKLLFTLRDHSAWINIDGCFKARSQILKISKYISFILKVKKSIISSNILMSIFTWIHMAYWMFYCFSNPIKQTCIFLNNKITQALFHCTLMVYIFCMLH